VELRSSADFFERISSARKNEPEPGKSKKDEMFFPLIGCFFGLDSWLVGSNLFSSSSCRPDDAKKAKRSMEHGECGDGGNP
jgi:hypothetical protein